MHANTSIQLYSRFGHLQTRAVQLSFRKKCYSQLYGQSVAGIKLQRQRINVVVDQEKLPKNVTGRSHVMYTLS